MELDLSIFEKLQDRPYDKAAAPVVVPDRFRNSGAVFDFMNRNNRALTWEQVEELWALKESMWETEKARMLAGGGASGPMAKLIEAWKQACENSKDFGERKRELSVTAAAILGADGPVQVDRVLSLYNTLGTRAVNRAIVELAKEQLTPGDRFKYLKHRAELQKQAEGNEGKIAV